MKSKNILFTIAVTPMLVASLFFSSAISANEIELEETNQEINEVIPTEEVEETVEGEALDETEATIIEDEVVESPIVEEVPNTQEVEESPVVEEVLLQTTSNDQTWNEVHQNINTVQELQLLINQAGTTPTKIFLNKNIMLHTPYDTGTPAGLIIGTEQTIYLTSEAGNNFTIDLSESESTTKAVIHVREGGVLYTENITLTGGDRTTDVGGGGGVLLGVGAKQSDKGAIYHMYEGTIIRDNAAGFGGGVYISEGSEFHMHGGEISTNSVKVRGGAVFGFKGSKFYLYDGDLRDNSTVSVGNSDSVFMEGTEDARAKFVMYNGRIFKSDLGLGQKTSRGGGVQIRHTDFDMHDGEIFNFFGNGTAGGVGVIDSVFNMYGGKIYRNINFWGNGVVVYSEARSGGYSTVNNSVFNMYGGIIGGESEEDGNLNESAYGAVGLGTGWGNQGGTFNMYGGKIKYNDSPGITSSGSGLVNIMGDSEISNNKRIGIRLVGPSRVTLNDEAVVTNNVGGIYAPYGTVTLNDDVKITNNHTTGQGGGIFTSGSSELYLNGGEISNNTAEGHGGGLYAAGHVYLRNIEFSGNESSANGGGIYASDYSRLHILDGGTISFHDNKSQYIGIATDIPSVGTYDGTIARTTLDSHSFTGILKDKINDFINNGGVLRELLVFNNHDINMESTEFFYEVEFNSNGGSEVPKQLVTDDGTGKAELPETPTLRHYTFDAWYMDPELTMVYDFDTIVESNMTLYAGWVRNVYNINYELHGGMNDDNNPMSYVSGIGVDGFAPATRVGYEFVGWYVNEAMFTSISEDMEGDITLHAQWEMIKDEEPNEETPTDNTPRDNDTELPQTGVSNIATMVAGLTIVMGGLVLVVSHMKKRENN